MKTDAHLRTDVEQELEWEPTVDSGQVGVAVEDGVVTLTGEVRSYAEKWHAERAAERVLDVRGVANEIKIRTPSEYNDTDIARAVTEALRWDPFLPNDKVMVKVDGGWVTLSGELPQDYQRRAAEQKVRYLRGVKGISNLLTVKPQVEVKDLERQIEQAFERRAQIDAKRVAVRADHGDVTLTGTVRSWSERQDAEAAAWAGPGVRSVANYLAVAPGED